MKKDYTHIVFVLDRSGSMAAIKEDTIGGFNEFLNSHKNAEGTATVTLAQFDDQYELLEDFTDIQSVKEMDETRFRPRGSTALRDAIGKTVVSVGEKLAELEEDERPEQVFVVVLTDGYENSSVEYKNEDIKKLITEQTEKYSWEFLFVGATSESVTSATRDYGFDSNKTMAFATTSKGSADLYTSMAVNTVSYRSTKNNESLNFTAEDRKLQQEEGAVADAV